MSAEVQRCITCRVELFQSCVVRSIAVHNDVPAGDTDIHISIGLIEALRRQVESFNRENGVTCEFKIIGSMNRLSLVQEVSIYRIILEALNNVRKHAQASHVDLILKFDLEYAIVEITDDGQGFDLSAALSDKVAKSSIGLITMKERAEMLGGALNIITAPGNGTKIFGRLPPLTHSDSTHISSIVAGNEQ